MWHCSISLRSRAIGVCRMNYGTAPWTRPLSLIRLGKQTVISQRGLPDFAAVSIFDSIIPTCVCTAAASSKFPAYSYTGYRSMNPYLAMSCLRRLQHHTITWIFCFRCKLYGIRSQFQLDSSSQSFSNLVVYRLISPLHKSNLLGSQGDSYIQVFKVKYTVTSTLSGFLWINGDDIEMPQEL